VFSALTCQRELLAVDAIVAHQRPFDGGDWSNAHVHVEIAVPQRGPGVPRFIAAGELGSGLYVNPVVPEQAAEELRAVTW